MQIVTESRARRKVEWEVIASRAVAASLASLLLMAANAEFNGSHYTFYFNVLYLQLFILRFNNSVHKKNLNRFLDLYNEESSNITNILWLLFLENFIFLLYTFRESANKLTLLWGGTKVPAISPF
jgi:hypothetical protein